LISTFEEGRYVLRCDRAISVGVISVGTDLGGAYWDRWRKFGPRGTRSVDIISVGAGSGIEAV